MAEVFLPVNIAIGPTQPTGFSTGQISVGTAAVQGPNVTVAQGHRVTLSCPLSNTHSVYIGGSPHVNPNTGFEIPRGGGVLVAVDNLNKLYFISTANGQVIRYACETP